MRHGTRKESSAARGRRPGRRQETSRNLVAACAVLTAGLVWGASALLGAQIEPAAGDFLLYEAAWRDPLGIRLVELRQRVRASGSAEEAAAVIRRDYPTLRLAQLLASPRPEVREAAAHSLGLVAEFGEVGLVVPALHDSDPAVHKAAEASCLRIFCRDGTAEDRHELALIIQRLQFGDPLDAVRRAGALIMRAPALAEAYNQRAIARYQLRQYLGSLQDCRRTLELNPHHFGAAIGMAQCYLAIDDRPAALEALELTERLNPDMAGVRAQIDVLRKLLQEAPASAEREPQRP